MPDGLVLIQGKLIGKKFMTTSCMETKQLLAILALTTYFGYDIIQLQYAQFGVVTGKEAATEAIEKFNTFRIGSMPLFNFAVDNLTGYDLTLTEDEVEVQGSWPLGNIKKRECAVAGFNRLHMSLAVRYTAY